MKRTRSIATRMSLVFLLLFLVTILVGVFGIASLSYFNRLSSRARDEWLPSTSLLGDLNNHTSDLRGLEAAMLLAADANAVTASAGEIADLDRTIRAVEIDYRQLPHDAVEDTLYATFATAWSSYRQQVAAIQTLAQSGKRASAVVLFNTTSKAAYDEASAALDVLTARSVADARDAVLREDVAYARAWLLIVATIVLTGLSVAAAMVYVRRSVSRPILELTDRMHRLAAADTGIEIEGTERPDEIGDMARAVVVFRGNAIELMNSRYGLEQQATMLRERLAEEQRLTQLQRNFVSMASHEFRTPITIIDGHAQQLIAMKGELGVDELEKRARRIRGAALRMTHLINGLIDSSRIVDGDVRLYFHPVRLDLVALLKDVCRMQREITPNAQVLERYRARQAYVFADANLLSQVFSNLLANAIKYSPGSGLIRIGLDRTPTGITVSIKDHGIGIPAADVGRLFERYFRGSNTAGIVGTGVGLYLVKTIVDLHGGDIEVESQEGAGSTLSVRLPPDRRECAVDPAAAALV